VLSWLSQAVSRRPHSLSAFLLLKTTPPLLRQPTGGGSQGRERGPTVALWRNGEDKKWRISD